MSITLGSRLKAPTHSLPPHLAQVYPKEIQLPTLTWKQTGLLMNSTRHYHVKANLTLICYSEIHFVSTYLYLLKDRNTPGKVLGRRKHMQGAEICQHGSSASSRQQEPLAQHSRRKTSRSAVPRQGHHWMNRTRQQRILFRNARRGPPRARSRGGATGWNSARRQRSALLWQLPEASRGSRGTAWQSLVSSRLRTVGDHCCHTDCSFPEQTTPVRREQVW